jgi:hypothetical protein
MTSMLGPTPLYHCVTSPPQGARSFMSHTKDHTYREVHVDLRSRRELPISTLVGEMSARPTEGGCFSKHMSQST